MTQHRDGSELDPRDEPRGSSAESFDSILFPECSSALPSQPKIPAPVEPRAPRSSRRLRGWLIGAALFLLLAAAGFFGFMAYDTYQQERARELQQEQEEQAEIERAELLSEAENPFSVLVGEVEAPSEDPLDVSVENDQLQLGAAMLSVQGGSLSPTVNGCSLAAITDICLGARGKLGDGSFDVLVVKDISRSRFLDDPVEFSEIELSPGTTAASLAIDMGNSEEPVRLGALTADGTTGFVLIFPAGTSADRVEEVLRAAVVI